MLPSSFAVLGIGVVTENKPSGEYYASIFLMEQSQLAESEINSKEKQDFSVETIDGSTKKMSIQEDYKVKAKWLRIGDSQRITPPDLTIGQKVLVITKPGYDEYYWVKIFEENSILINENVTYGFMARHKDDKATVSPSYLEEMYRLSISTEAGEIRFTTTDAAEEKTTYTLLMDTKNGIMGYEDKQGNYRFLNSVDGIVMSNLLKDENIKIGGKQNHWIVDNTTTKIEGSVNTGITKSTILKCDDKLNIKVKDSIAFENNGEFNVKTVKDIQAKTMGSIILNSNQDFHILNNGGKTTIISPSGVSIVAPKIDLVGSVQCGTLSCIALNIGGAAPTPPQMKQPNIEAIDMSPFDDAMSALEEALKEEDKEQENGSSSSENSSRSRQKDSSSEQEDDPWKDETKPSEPEKIEEPAKAISKMEKEAEMQAMKGLTITSDVKIICQSNNQAEFSGTMTKIEGKAGMQIVGVTGDLTDVIFNAIDSICKLIDTPVPVTGTAPAPGSFTGVTVPTGSGATTSTAIKSLLQSWKGGGSRSSNFRARSLGLPENPSMDIDKFKQDLDKILTGHMNNVTNVMNEIKNKENGDDNSSD